MPKNRTRKVLSGEEKLLKALQGMFILQAASMQMSGAEIRKILGINMNEITPILKAASKAMKNHPKKPE